MESYVAGEDFNVYLERLENFMELNEAAEEKYKILLLCNLIGPDASHKLSKACKPKQPKEYTYVEVIEKFKDLFASKYTSCINVVKFNRRTQARGEGIHDYAIDLMTLAQSCQFGDYKDKALRNQLISGVYNRNPRADLMALDKKKTFLEVQRAMVAEIIQKEVDINIGVSMTNSSEDKSRLSYGNESKLKSQDVTRARSNSRVKGCSASRLQRSNKNNIQCYNWSKGAQS